MKSEYFSIVEPKSSKFVNKFKKLNLKYKRPIHLSQFKIFNKIE
jgi:hypothetical protein